MTINLNPRNITRFEKGGNKVFHVNVPPQIMTRERAEEIWANRHEFYGSIDMTVQEEAYVHAVWDTMAGNTCFMDAFHKIRRGEVDKAV